MENDIFILSIGKDFKKPKAETHPVLILINLQAQKIS